MKLTTEILKSGKPLKRKDWEGYWCGDPSINQIDMHCKNDKIISFLKTNDLFFTIDNLLADDWEYATKENCPVLKKELEEH